MKITTNELKKLCNIILADTEAKGIKEVNIDVDYYWTIDTLDAINFDNKNPDIVVGSFIDDWNSLLKVLSDENPMSYVDCDRLGNILNIVGYEISTAEKTSYKKITLKSLKKICEKIWSVIERSSFREFIISINQYQYINHNESFDFTTTIKHVQLGYLINDWNNLKKILSSQTETTIADFEKLGILIKAIGYVISNTNDRFLLDLRKSEH